MDASFAKLVALVAYLASPFDRFSVYSRSFGVYRNKKIKRNEIFNCSFSCPCPLYSRSPGIYRNKKMGDNRGQFLITAVGPVRDVGPLLTLTGPHELHLFGNVEHKLWTISKCI